MEENEKKKGQIFYFTEDGKLVVESNKGIWVDGEQFVKMYGNFSCNAKTMGAIIAAMKGIPVEIGEKQITAYRGSHMFGEELLKEHDFYCVLGVDDTRIDEYLTALAKEKFTNHEIEKARYDSERNEKIKKEAVERVQELEDEIYIHNNLPWYKRFRKIKL